MAVSKQSFCTQTAEFRTFAPIPQLGIETCFYTPLARTEIADQRHVTQFNGGLLHRIENKSSTSASACCTCPPQSYPQTHLQHSKVNYKLVITTEKTKRPSAETRRPLLIHPLATTNGGTVPESTDGRTTAAVTHLNLLRTAPGNAPYFVRLAYVYGLTIPHIVQESSLPVDAVQRMVLGGD